MTKAQTLQHTCSTIHKPLISRSHTVMRSFSVQIEFRADNETINENKRSVFCVSSDTVMLRPSIRKLSTLLLQEWHMMRKPIQASQKQSRNISEMNKRQRFWPLDYEHVTFLLGNFTFHCLCWLEIEQYIYITTGIIFMVSLS